VTDPRKFKAPFIPKERIWQEADRLRAQHPAGQSLPVRILDLALGICGFAFWKSLFKLFQ